MVAAALPELDDHQGIVTFIDSLVSGMFMAAEVKAPHLLLNIITADNTCGGMRRTR
jgi:hypothetical protein